MDGSKQRPGATPRASRGFAASLLPFALAIPAVARALERLAARAAPARAGRGPRPDPPQGRRYRFFPALCVLYCVRLARAIDLAGLHREKRAEERNGQPGLNDRTASTTSAWSASVRPLNGAANTAGRHRDGTLARLAAERPPHLRQVQGQAVEHAGNPARLEMRHQHPASAEGRTRWNKA